MKAYVNEAQQGAAADVLTHAAELGRYAASPGIR